MRLVPINCIKESTFLAKTIYDIEGRTLLKKGVSLNAVLLSRLQKHGIHSLYIDDNYSAIEIKEIIKPEIKQLALKAIKETFEMLEKHNNCEQNSNCHTKISDMEERHRHVTELSSIAKDIVNDLMTHKQLFINLVDIKTMDNYTYEHSLSVAILSLILGLEIGLSKHELNDLCVGAMLHDIGKIFVPPEILNKPSTLTQNEYQIIKSHVVKGYNYLFKDYSVKATSRLIALQHHESCDGTGYPNNLKSAQIHKFAKIVAIADIYDAMTSDRPYRIGIQPNEVIEYIMGNAGSRFEYDLVLAFVRKIMPYPVGTLVELSNGQYAYIEEINYNFPLRPVVRIAGTTCGTAENSTIDLMQATNIVISKILYEMPEFVKPIESKALA